MLGSGREGDVQDDLILVLTASQKDPQSRV